MYAGNLKEVGTYLTYKTMYVHCNKFLATSISYVLKTFLRYLVLVKQYRS